MLKLKTTRAKLLKSILPIFVTTGLLIGFQNCGRMQSQTGLSKDGHFSVSNSDCQFNNNTVADGASVDAYQSSSVPYGQQCVKESRVCSSGLLSGSFDYASCAAGAPAACLFNGQTVAHGASIAAYVTSTVPFGQSCTLETRNCNNGQLSGSFSYATCSVGTPAACMFNGQTIAHGATVVAYGMSTVPYGQSCATQAQTRICNNGTLSGSYIYGSCTVNQPASCLFNGQTIANGGSVTAYSSSSVAYGQSCSSVAQSRVCSNGTLSGSFGYSTCAAASSPVCNMIQGQYIDLSRAGYSNYVAVAYPSTQPVTSGLLVHMQGLPSDMPLSACVQYCQTYGAKACLYNTVANNGVVFGVARCEAFGSGTSIFFAPGNLGPAGVQPGGNYTGMTYSGYCQ